MEKKSNKLINQKSPYLLQHAYNPVDWYPWCEEAFEKAREENKPVFLSIGYSTCHWCHVMERESFEDEDVAKLMNEVFISIKVDREERPDIDGIYMSVCQLITGSGGWPLTVFLTHDKKPFFAGTYFPKYNRFNRIGLMELIPRIKDLWLNKKDELLKSASEISLALINQNRFNEIEHINNSLIEKTYYELKNRYDNNYGGFGNAPKFPSPHNLLFLLRCWHRDKNNEALSMVENTITKMRLGGIYDHIGFGFSRYSTDRFWMVPHFEKMLYDQAMLLMAYTESYLITKNDLYKRTSEEIIKYVLRDMTNNEGGFYSAEDADSEGEEGRFYLWTADELRTVLDKNECDLVFDIFNITENGNWVDESKGTKNRTNILHIKEDYEQLALKLEMPEPAFTKIINTIREKLFAYREKRIHPHKDDKILTDWNALMISALAKAYQVYDKVEYLDAAINAYNFIEKNLVDKNGQLLHRYRDGEPAVYGFLDDYAFMIQASLDLFESVFEPKYLESAIRLSDILNNEFWDEINGGFFFTSTQNETLLTRQKEVYDGAIPSGNSIALLNLIRISRITARHEFEIKANQLINCFSKYISKSPSAFTMFMCGIDAMLNPSTEIVITYDNDDQTAKKMLEYIRSKFLPGSSIIVCNNNTREKLNSLIPALINLTAHTNKTTAYVCRNYNCDLPVYDVEGLTAVL